MFVIDDVFLAAVAKAILSAAATQAANAGFSEDKLRRLLGRDPQRLALRRALRDTLKEFDDIHPEYTTAFSDKAFLTGPAAPIVAKCLLRGSGPDSHELALAWDSQFGSGELSNPRSRIEAATPVAAEFLQILDRKLRESAEFQLIYDSRALDAIAEHTADTAASVARLEQLLKNVFELRDDATDSLAGYIMDVKRFCEERTLNFVGRQFLLDRIDDRLCDPEFPNGYIVLRGEPGIGKSALMAYLVLNRGYLHHFNIVTSGVTTPDQFLGNLCAQLIVRYQLPYHELPLPRATRDSVFLGELLDQVANDARIRGELPIVIAIDALDEADRSNPGNVLLLPADLPDGVYVLATTRPLEYDRLSVEQRHVIDIDENDPANLDDIRTYIANDVCGRHAEDWAARLTNWGTTSDELIQTLVQQSEGNFMYVKYVLGDLRSQRLSFDDLGAWVRTP